MKRLAVAIRLPLVLGMGALATATLLWLLSHGSTLIQAQGPDGYSTYHVAPSCAGVPAPCYTSVQAAVDAADDPDDVIKVAAGTYTGVAARAGVTQVVYISKAVAIRGGYTTAFTEPPDPEANPTTLNAQGGGRVLYVTGNITPAVEGLRLTGGDVAGLAGGGVYIVDASVTLKDNTVFSNAASIGGGLFLSSSNATLVGNTVSGNVTYYGEGGGLYLTGGEATLTGNNVTSNTSAWHGGGLYMYLSDATVSGNRVFSNVAYYGGGLFLNNSDAKLNGNTIFSNTAYEGGGVYILQGTATIRNNYVFSNAASWGGGLYLSESASTLSGNTVTSNAASQFGGGLSLWYSDATLSGNTVSSNTSRWGGGGLYLVSSKGMLSGNDISANTTGGGGGGLSLNDNSHVTLIGNIINGNFSGSGGGLNLYHSNATLINNVVADNEVDTEGSALRISDSSPTLLHNTIARNRGGDGSGLHVTQIGAMPSSVSVTNTILVSQTVGITVTTGNTVTLHGTLWGSGVWANEADWSGGGKIITGTVNLWGDPDFVDPDNGDYHIGPDSAALDAGVESGVTIDIDGETRPAGSGYDMGADEYYSVTNSPPNEPSDPVPADGAMDQDVNVDLSWTGGDPDGDSVTYDVYIEANDPTPADLMCDDVATPACDPGTLAYDTHYYWYVAARDEHGATTVGATWGFYTEPEPNHPPQPPQNLSPADGATEMPLTATLSWQGGDPDGDVVTYTVAFGTGDPPPYAATTQQTQYAPALKPNSTYYWSITASDGLEVSAGPVWRFSTLEEYLIYLPLVLRGLP